MARWLDVERAEPELARRVRELFEAHRHKTIATLRADGSPRISGIEAVFEDGELTFGSMPNARKGADLLRDPRFALHSATVDPVEGSEAEWPGEAKVASDVALVLVTHRAWCNSPLAHTSAPRPALLGSAATARASARLRGPSPANSEAWRMAQVSTTGPRAVTWRARSSHSQAVSSNTSVPWIRRRATTYATMPDHTSLTTPPERLRRHRGGGVGP